ncbi:hypothetical protein BDR04DRAFT_1155571 [Suillus decipiens]|nr:hypothetical protein BDR04DRAFT_1155571 [Suillus decipiens]
MASAGHERWIAVRPDRRGRLDHAKEVLQTTPQFFGDEEEQVQKAQAAFNAFAKMETRLKEYERARVIYKFALSRLPRSKSANLYAAYTKFEKQHGTRSIVESTVLGKRRIQYEDEVSQDGRNYDVWFDYVRLEEGALRTLREEGGTKEEEDAATERVRDVYERAVAHVPPGQEKRHWRRYIFLWLEYALFEEIETKDYDRARQVYRTALNLVPHKQFTFAKLWIMAARFELREFDRVWLYEKYLQAVFELGVSQASPSIPEIKSFGRHILTLRSTRSFYQRQVVLSGRHKVLTLNFEVISMKGWPLSQVVGDTIILFTGELVQVDETEDSMVA